VETIGKIKMILLIILIYENDELVALMDIINTITAVILLINTLDKPDLFLILYI
jgi:hypothetical protein